MNHDDASADLHEAIEEMMRELETDPVFLPSEFWRDINKKNIAMLEADGIENFKRSISQNYYNWIMMGRRDPQFVKALGQWLRHPSIEPLRTTLEPGIELRLLSSDTKIALSPRSRWLYRVFVSLLWENMLRADKLGLAKQIEEPEVGNPIRIWRRGRVITQDLANSIMECNVIALPAPAGQARQRIAEIGAGSGRLAHVYASTQSGTYFIFDIPPALFVSQWYLPRVLLGKKIFKFRPFADFSSVRDEIEASDVAFFTANQIRHFPERYFDAIVSISTLPEMRPDQVSLYLDLMQKLSRQTIFLKQWSAWKNTVDGTDMTRDDYKLGDDWKLVVDQGDPVNPMFFNRVWRRD